MLTILAHRVDYKKYHYLVQSVIVKKESYLSFQRFHEVYMYPVIISEESISNDSRVRRQIGWPLTRL